jgi:hypothetical protein
MNESKSTSKAGLEVRQEPESSRSWTEGGVGRVGVTLLCGILAGGAICSAKAVDLCVRPTATGNGTGMDWSNALGGGFTPVRGNRYFIAGGTYGARVWNIANAGTSTITIKKATDSEHGPEAGWASSLGAGRAHWVGGWVISTDYWVFDGGLRDTNWMSGATEQYGFRVSNSGKGAKAIRLDDGSGNGGDYVSFENVDAAGGGQGTGFGDDVVYGLTGNKGIVFRACALRDSDRTIFLQRGEWSGLLVEYCYMARNNSTPTTHGELLSDTGSDNQTFRYNVIEDIEGTGVWAVLNGTGTKSAANTASGWRIHGNIIRSTGSGEPFAGVIYVANNVSNRNWMDDLKYYNNTHVNLKCSYYGIYMEVGGSGNEVKNNLWFKTVAATHINMGDSGANYYADTPTNDAGAATVRTTGTDNALFIDEAVGDYRLTRALPGLSLQPEFNRDILGGTRGADGAWDRGGLEYGVGAPRAPQGLRVVGE